MSALYGLYGHTTKKPKNKKPKKKTAITLRLLSNMINHTNDETDFPH